MENRNPNTSSLLIAESPLCIQPSLAVAIGLNEAIFLQQCHYWLNPKFNKNIINGKHWVHKTLQQWVSEFPFWGEKTIRRVISNLEKLNIIISNVTTNGFKKTKFFTIDYDVLNGHVSSKPAETLGAAPSGQSDQIDLPKRADGSGHIDHFEMVRLTRSYKEDRLPTEITPLSSSKPLSKKSDPIAPENERENVSVSKKMISIWNDILPEKKQTIVSKQLERNLERALSEQLDGNLENWNVLCENWKSSKFLMGEAVGVSMKPSLSWLVDPQKDFVYRVFAKDQWTFDDRAVAAKPTQNIDEAEEEIESASDNKIIKDLRLFTLQSNPGFYQSYVKQAQFELKGDEVELTASSDFSREKIAETSFDLMKTYLQERYQLNLELK